MFSIPTSILEIQNSFLLYEWKQGKIFVYIRIFKNCLLSYGSIFPLVYGAVVCGYKDKEADDYI